MNSIVFFDTEVGIEDKKIWDIGALWNKEEHREEFHNAHISKFQEYIRGTKYICGHNIVHHDLKFLPDEFSVLTPIDTLYLSPLLFPSRPYHKLLKDDKLRSDQINNPLNDAKNAMNLFYDEVNAFEKLSDGKKQIYCSLLDSYKEFKGFFEYLGYQPKSDGIEALIWKEFNGKVCVNADISRLIQTYPRQLAYSLALIDVTDFHSVTPSWCIKEFPEIDIVIRYLCGRPCDNEKCKYCRDRLDIHKNLKEKFGFEKFRTYNGEPLQEKAVQAAVNEESLLAVFPTGGGKSLTFQLPALMAGECAHGLTVVISPLQSLMKDQVDNLSAKGFADAVTVNGLLSSIERSEAFERVENGLATILYISPEQLRSRTIEKLLLGRNVVRFVIDEAHCFSAWGQDFRVDYMYIGKFIRKYQEKKNRKTAVPVSCFTATAKQKVISDICDYFKRELGIPLKLFTSSADRSNLHYFVLFKETEEEKYNELRNLIEQKNCPTIVYVSRVSETQKLAEKLTSDGFPAKPFNGKMVPKEKITNQEYFINNETKVIVATSAFGMGVDKSDVCLVVHYDISSSLEDYVQEAGRAGRNQELNADCYVLFNDDDLDKHFILLNQTKLSISEIQQIWKAIKFLTRERNHVCCSALELARQAGWDDEKDFETRVRSAIAALESAGYVEREQNSPRVYATSVLAQNMEEARFKIDKSPLFDAIQKQNAIQIMSSLISSHAISKAQEGEAESRVDYIADRYGMEKEDVVDCVNKLRLEGLLDDDQDMKAYILKSENENRSKMILNRFAKIEKFLLDYMQENGTKFSYKELNEAALNVKVPSTSVKNIKTVLFFLTIKGYISKGQKQETEDVDYLIDDDVEVRTQVYASPTMEWQKIKTKSERRMDICSFVVERLFEKASEKNTGSEKQEVQFSLVNLLVEYKHRPNLNVAIGDTSLADVEEALLYLSKIGAMTLEGGFLVLYQGLNIRRLKRDNLVRYKKEDYATLNEYYKQKIQQIHIVGEYAHLMVKDYNSALQFVRDYFQIDYKDFISKYFKGDRQKEILCNITPKKYDQIFGSLSKTQKQIIDDESSKTIVVAAGPGSGKTRVLVHKLASLLLLEDVKHEQLLMLTFSRAAATEFKKRLIELVGNSAYYVDIKTFHSYCFDLLGKIGRLDGSEKSVVHDAVEMINNGEVEPGKIAKKVLVIDEAQDIDADEFALIKALMAQNEDMRVIAVGDDDQNIYEFRGSNSKYMQTLLKETDAKFYEMTDNYRSTKNVVALANRFVKTIHKRMKSNPILPVSNDSGVVQIIHHISESIEQPIVQHYLKNKGDDTCILTSTNEEALLVFGLLINNGVPAKLVQSLDDFDLFNLAEFRFFINCIDNAREDAPVISNDIWQDSKKKLKEKYKKSACLENVLNLINGFETINQKSMYRTDLEEYIRESSYEDSFDNDTKTVFVSTIHKSKGREFDNVYILLNKVSTKNDEERRKLYVGMTRAKKNLYIHCNSKLFDNYDISGIKHYSYDTVYENPNNLILQLSHRDVFLGYFKGKENLVLELQSGDEMFLQDSKNGDFYALLNNKKQCVVKLSKAGLEMLNTYLQKGYVIDKVKVRFVVYWQGREEASEIPIVLPTVYLTKKDK